MQHGYKIGLAFSFITLIVTAIYFFQFSESQPSLQTNQFAPESLQDTLAQIEKQPKSKLAKLSLKTTQSRLPASVDKNSFYHPKLGELQEMDLVAVPPRVARERSLKVYTLYRGWALVHRNDVSQGPGEQKPFVMTSKATNRSQTVLLQPMIRIKLVNLSYLKDLQTFLGALSVNVLDQKLSVVEIPLPLNPSNGRTPEELLRELNTLSYVKVADIPELPPRVEPL